MQMRDAVIIIICEQRSHGDNVLRVVVLDGTEITKLTLSGCIVGYDVGSLHVDAWRKRSIPTHSEWLYPLTFDAGKGLKEA